jgi:hypothetical protein
MKEEMKEVEDVSLSEITTKVQRPTINPYLLRLIALLGRAWALDDVLQALGDGQKTDTPLPPWHVDDAAGLDPLLGRDKLPGLQSFPLWARDLAHRL